jgi:hypothetical protein
MTMWSFLSLTPPNAAPLASIFQSKLHGCPPVCRKLRCGRGLPFVAHASLPAGLPRRWQQTNSSPYPPPPLFLVACHGKQRGPQPPSARRPSQMWSTAGLTKKNLVGYFVKSPFWLFFRIGGSTGTERPSSGGQSLRGQKNILKYNPISISAQ